MIANRGYSCVRRTDSQCEKRALLFAKFYCWDVCKCSPRSSPLSLSIHSLSILLRSLHPPPFIPLPHILLAGNWICYTPFDGSYNLGTPGVLGGTASEFSTEFKKIYGNVPDYTTAVSLFTLLSPLLSSFTLFYSFYVYII